MFDYELVSLYTLSDPRTGVIKYIGKTTGFLRHRLADHLRAATSQAQAEWIRELKKEQLTPIIERLEYVREDEVDYWERYWIHQFLEWGYKLNNITCNYTQLKNSRPKHICIADYSAFNSQFEIETLI
jgi:hypothetical protein